MMLQRWRRREPRCERDQAPEIRDRLAALERERLELLADERVPGRKHRLDALAAASGDLRTELARLEAGDDRGAVSPPTPCRTGAGSP